MNERFNAVAGRLEQRSPVEIEGIRFSFSLTEIRHARRHNDSPVEVRIAAQRMDSTEQPQAIELHVGREKLADPDYIADLAIDTLQMILQGRSGQQQTT